MVDQDRGDSKRTELVTAVARRLAPLVAQDRSTEAAKQIVDAFCAITPPEPPEIVFELITMSVGGRRGARSRKLGNLALNFRKLVGTLASGTLTVVGITTAAPWVAILGALGLWDSLWSKMELDIQEREASVLWAMWANRNNQNHVSQEGLLEKVNAERARHGRARLSEAELEDALATLGKMETIEDAHPHWWLREWVKVDFE